MWRGQAGHVGECSQVVIAICVERLGREACVGEVVWRGGRVAECCPNRGWSGWDEVGTSVVKSGWTRVRDAWNACRLLAGLGLVRARGRCVDEWRVGAR